MSEFDLEIDDADLHRKLDEIERRLPEEGRRAEREGAAAQVRALASEVPKRTGAMADSFHVEEIDGGSGAVTRHPGAGILDSGGTIKAKRGALAIPFSSSGAARVTEARAMGLVTVRPDASRPLLAQISENGFDPHFTLIDQVTLRGTGYVERAVERAAGDVEQAALEAAERAVG